MMAIAESQHRLTLRAIDDQLSFLGVEPQACRRCGCTNYSACPGGCWWVEVDLCSQCAAAEALEVRP